MPAVTVRHRQLDEASAPITAWTLIQEIPIPADVTDLLIDGEQAVAAYKTFRDSAIFTDKRLIVRDAEMEMWTKAGHIKIKLNKKCDIRRLDKLIAWAVLK